jgi:putative transposase
MKKYAIDRVGKRIYPPRRRVGIRASNPFELMHLDLSVIKLTNGSKAYIQALLCNYSRYVFAWSVSLVYGAAPTKALILKGLAKAKELGMKSIPDIMVDAGSENDNEQVNSLIKSKLITRTIARLEIDFSNSMVEALFFRLKNAYLYLQQLTSLEALIEGVDFYITESNSIIPHSALKGATPFEKVHGVWTGESLASIAMEAAQAQSTRLAANHSSVCGICPR